MNPIEQDRIKDMTKLAASTAEAISDLYSETRTELLFVMCSVRDITFGVED